MIDFWRTVGWMLVDANVRNTLFASFGEGELCDRAHPNVTRLHLDKTRYDTQVTSSIRRRIWNLVPPNRSYPIALWSTGELLYGLSRTIFRTEIPVMAGEVQAPAGFSDEFLSGLGALAVDAGIRPVAAAQNLSSLGFRLSAPEAAELARLATAGGSFAQSSDRLCRGDWDPNCGVRIEFYPGHLHVRS
jgi:hypothetical protein